MKDIYKDNLQLSLNNLVNATMRASDYVKNGNYQVAIMALHSAIESLVDAQTYKTRLDGVPVDYAKMIKQAIKNHKNNQ